MNTSGSDMKGVVRNFFLLISLACLIIATSAHKLPLGRGDARAFVLHNGHFQSPYLGHAGFRIMIHILPAALIYLQIPKILIDAFTDPLPHCCAHVIE